MRSIGPLPQPATPLVGREAELARVKRWLRGPDVRFVTLVGAPGTGKTRLAIATAHDMLGGFEQGVTFVDLTTLSRPEQVAPAIAHALEIGYTGRLPDGLEETLRRVLSDQHRLLVLDNCDRLLASAGMVLELVAACPHLKVLVTSREPMRVAAEHQFLVPPLAVPDLTRLPPIAELARVPAVRLFRLRVRSVQPGWELNDRNAAAVAELCVRLDGLPLAIELAASWMRVLSPRAMLPQLAEALDLLVGGRPDQPERHQTLRAAIAWSHDLLGEPERRLFRRLAVFRNGWTVEACAAVCSEPGTAQVETLKPLGTLVDKHLVLRSEDQDGNVRFRLLETLHAFAQEQVVASGELEALRERHATFFVDLAEQAERELDSPLQAAWLERLEAERENIRAALTWCSTADNPAAAELGLRLGAALWLFWDVRGHVQEGQEPLRAVLQLPASVRSRTRERARALQSEGWLGYVRGDVAEVEMVVAESLDIARELGDTALAARSLAILGTALAAHSTDWDRMTTVLDEALALARQVGDHSWTMGFAIYNLGVVAMKRGQLGDAADAFERGRQLSAASGNTFGIACSLFRQGWLASAQMNVLEAVALLRESLRLNWALRYQRVVALCLAQLACLSPAFQTPADQARLFGVVDALLGQLPDYTLPPQMAEAHRRGVEAARSALSKEAFAQGWAEGRRMTMEEAVGFALGDGELDTAQPAADGPSVQLSGREYEVLDLVVEGLTDREVAGRLGISTRTVDNHLRHIFDKVGVSTRTALAAWAVRARLRQ